MNPFKLSAIRQYDEDWNHRNKLNPFYYTGLSAIRQYDEDWNYNK